MKMCTVNIKLRPSSTQPTEERVKEQAEDLITVFDEVVQHLTRIGDGQIEWTKDRSRVSTSITEPTLHLAPTMDGWVEQWSSRYKDFIITWA